MFWDINLTVVDAHMNNPSADSVSYSILGIYDSHWGRVASGTFLRHQIQIHIR